MREIRQSVVAIGTLPDLPSRPSGQLFHDGRLVDFDVRGTGFTYTYTPIEFAEGKSDPDPKTSDPRAGGSLLPSRLSGKGSRAQ